MRNSRIALFLAVGAVTPLVPALTPATASAAENPLRPYLRQKPAWHRCATELPASFQCATLKVPLDYGRPDAKKLDIAISRMRTSTERERRGVLLLNPGGPGGPGIDMPQYMADELPKAVKNKYDLVGFDPRGIGRSSPVDCGLTSDERNWEPIL